MKFSTVAAAAALSCVLGAQALAQQPAAPAPATPWSPTGPVIPGVCMASMNGALGRSKVGQYASSRLEQIGAQTNAELNQTNTQLETERQTLQGQIQSQGQAALKPQIDALNQKYAQFASLSDQRSAELDQTKMNVLRRLNQEIGPVIRQVATAHNCTILLDTDNMVLNDPRVDLTVEIATGLDARLTEFPIERAQMQQQPAAQ